MPFMVRMRVSSSPGAYSLVVFSFHEIRGWLPRVHDVLGQVRPGAHLEARVPDTLQRVGLGNVQRGDV
jgi:hypothetical protein